MGFIFVRFGGPRTPLASIFRAVFVLKYRTISIIFLKSRFLIVIRLSGEGSVLISLLTCMRVRMCDAMAGRANFANGGGGKSFFLTTDNAGLATEILTAATCGKDFWTRRTVVRYNNNNNTNGPVVMRMREIAVVSM